MPKYVPTNVVSGVEAVVITEDIGASLELLVRARVPFRCDGDDPTNAPLRVGDEWVSFDEQTVVVRDENSESGCYTMPIEQFEKVYQLA